MNVCIKCGRCPLALETYNKMRQEGCAANVVTFNTLIDVYGKMGQWEQANRVPGTMKTEVGTPTPLHSPCESTPSGRIWPIEQWTGRYTQGWFVTVRQTRRQCEAS